MPENIDFSRVLAVDEVMETGYLFSMFDDMKKSFDVCI